MKDDTFELWPIRTLRETDKAYLVVYEDTDDLWLPKSQTTVMASDEDTNLPTRVSIPEWLAKKKDLL